MGGEEEEEEKVEVTMMKPWEQHSSVILIPRYDYNAPSSLLQRSHTGFLITCTIKREKSATKEAMSILEKYVGSFNSGSSDSDTATKKRKICSDEADEKSASGSESISATDEAVSEKVIATEDTGEQTKVECLSSVESIQKSKKNYILSLVKLSRSGLLLLTFTKENYLEAVDIVSNIFRSLESSSLKSPEWCHRIFPIQATCSLNESELRPVVSKLVRQFVNSNQHKLTQPITFAIGYNRRGVEATEMKNSKDDQIPLLDREKCFAVVATAVKDVVSNAVVNLKSPQMSILIELLPLSGVRKGSLVVAVSVLSLNLVSTKPRLCIRALVSDSNTKKGKS